jgi:hypothetical protein
MGNRTSFRVAKQSFNRPDNQSRLVHDHRICEPKCRITALGGTDIPESVASVSIPTVMVGAPVRLKDEHVFDKHVHSSDSSKVPLDFIPVTRALDD